VIVQGNDPYTQPSFSWQNRLARGVWGIVWQLLFRPTPWFMHSWRSFLLRLFGARIGREVHVYPNVKIWAPWLLKIGNRVGVANGVLLYNMALMTIEDECVISQGAHLCCGSHDIHSSNFQLIAAPIVLRPKVWVCADVFVGPGVEVVEGCVLSARAVVMRSISQSWTVWAGHPAILIKNRKNIS
jgi:putative colanic acid biosynthesis acetyltransferase WcaF